MQFTYYGHSTFSVSLKGKSVLFDPFITHNGLAAHIDLSTIKADYILVSHGHSDHIADCVQLAKQTGAQVVTSFEVAEWLGKAGVSTIMGLNHGGQHHFDFGSVKCVNAIHSSSMPDGSYGGNPMGFVIKSDFNFYYSGDTALTMDMQLIPRWAKLDAAVLCIGDVFTMGYEDAVEAARMVQCTKVVGVHYDTFPPIKLDRDKATAAFKEAGIELLLPQIGQTIEL